jgi:hypothetical protein
LRHFNPLLIPVKVGLVACRCKKSASWSYIMKTLSVVIFDLAEALLVAAALALLIGAAWVSL